MILYIIGWLLCGLVAYGLTLPLIEEEIQFEEVRKLFARFMLLDCLLLGALALSFIALSVLARRQKYKGFKLF